MPHAVSIAALPASAMLKPSVPGEPQGKASATARTFGELFREQASPAPVSLAKATPAAGKSEDAANSQEGKDAKALSESSAKVGNTETQQNTEPSRIQQPSSASALSNAPQSLALKLSQSASRETASGEAAAEVAVESSKVSLPEPKITSTASPKETNSPPSTNTRAQHKTKEANSTVTPVLLSNVSTQVLAMPSPGQPIPASENDRQAESASAQKSTEEAGGKGSAIPTIALSQTVSAAGASTAGIQAATASTSSSKGKSEDQPVPSSGPEAHKETSEPVATAHETTASHGGPAAESRAFAGEVTAVASSASSVEPHVVGMEGSVLPHAAQPAGTAAAVSNDNSPVNLYDKIDQGSAPVMLHSGEQHMAVGVRDPDLGWVEIRTQNASGHVDAMLVTTSGQTHATLASQLPAMTQYLQQREVRIGTLTVQQQPQGTGTSGGQNHGSGGEGAPHSNTGRESNVPRYAGASSGTLGVGTGEIEGTFRAVSYISVRA